MHSERPLSIFGMEREAAIDLILIFGVNSFCANFVACRKPFDKNRGFGVDLVTFVVLNGIVHDHLEWLRAFVGGYSKARRQGGRVNAVGTTLNRGAICRRHQVKWFIAEVRWAVRGD